MTRRRLTALACYAGAALLATGAAYTGHHGHAIPTVGLVYGALVLAWCGLRDTTADRRERALIQRAKLAARPAPPPPPAPCCRLARHSHGNAHGTDCTRDGAPLTAHEQSVIADLEAHYDDRSAA